MFFGEGVFVTDDRTNYRTTERLNDEQPIYQQTTYDAFTVVVSDLMLLVAARMMPAWAVRCLVVIQNQQLVRM